MKRKYVALFAAASMAAGAVGVRAQNQATPDQAQLQQQQQPAAVVPQQQDQNVAGTAGASAATGAQSPYTEDIRRVLARVTEQAVKGDVKDVADYFTTNSKDQFSHYGKEARDTGPNATANDDQAKQDAKQADDQLKDTAKQFADAWKAKYGHDFNLDRKNEPLVYSGDTFRIMQGDMAGTARLQQARPAAGEVGGQADTNRDKNAGGAVDMNKRMATVMVKESHGAPQLTLTLVNEGTFGNRWHIQPPPGLDYKSLAMNLNHHLQQVVNMKDQWPQDENEAYKSVSHHMLAAIAMPMGTQAAGRQLQQQQQQQQPADLNTAQPAGQLQQPGSDQTSQQPQQQGQQGQPSQQDQQNQPSR